jgi:hypothetical protein
MSPLGTCLAAETCLFSATLISSGLVDPVRLSSVNGSFFIAGESRPFGRSMRQASDCLAVTVTSSHQTVPLL